MLRAKSSSRVASWPCAAALVDVGVPAADVGERDLEADVGLRELRDLLAAPGRTGCADSRRRAPAGSCAGSAVFSILHRVERLAAVPFSTLIGGGGVLRLERRAQRSLPPRMPNCASWFIASAGAAP